MSDSGTSTPIQVRWSSFDPGTEGDDLANLLSANVWPYHGTTAPLREVALEWIAAGRFGNGSDVRGFWGHVGVERVAFLAIRELEDPTPVFDLRVAEPWRRRGVGRSALRFLAEWTFGEGEKHRVEAHTRSDNESMRGLLRAQGWVQEAHHRQAWPDNAGHWYDAVTYALLRDDYIRSVRTPRPALDD